MIYILTQGGGGAQFPIIHPIFVNFTAALIPVSVAADLLGRALKRESLRATGWWTLLLAAIVTPFTALAGWLWMRSMDDMNHWQMVYHKWIGIIAAFAFIALALWRGLLYRRERWPGVLYFIVAFILLGVLGFQGELGGSMSFGRALFIREESSVPAALHNHEDGNGSPVSPGDESGRSALDTAIAPSESREHNHSMTGIAGGGWKDHIDLSTQPATKP